VINPPTTLAEIASQLPALTRELERLSLDYCCGGTRSLAEACQERGVDADAIAAELSGVAGADTPAADWIGLAPAEPVDHLEATHHQHLKGELPRLSALAARVSRVPGDRHPELVEVAEVFKGLRADLEPHHRQQSPQLSLRLDRQPDRRDGAGTRRSRSPARAAMDGGPGGGAEAACLTPIGGHAHNKARSVGPGRVSAHTTSPTPPLPELTPPGCLATAEGSASGLSP